MRLKMAVPTKRRTSRRQSANAVPVCSCKPAGGDPPCTGALAAKLSHNEIIAADLLYFQLLQALPHRHLAVVRDFTRTRRPHQFESHWSSKQVRSPNASIFTLNRSQITRSQQRRQVYQLKLYFAPNDTNILVEQQMVIITCFNTSQVSHDDNYT